MVRFFKFMLLLVLLMMMLLLIALNCVTAGFSSAGVVMGEIFDHQEIMDWLRMTMLVVSRLMARGGGSMRRILVVDSGVLVVVNGLDDVMLLVFVLVMVKRMLLSRHLVLGMIDNAMLFLFCLLVMVEVMMVGLVVDRRFFMVVVFVEIFMIDGLLLDMVNFMMGGLMMVHVC